MAKWNPVLVCSPGGWLPDECRRHGIDVIEEIFPRSRSASARWFGNAAFARRVTEKINLRSLRPDIVNANDHQEGLLGLRLAKQLRAKTAMFLRSSAMSRNDYLKYRCDEYDFISAVGDEFRNRAQEWEVWREIKLVHDGIFAEEIELPKSKPAAAPKKVIVIGSPLDWKGWADLTAALYLLEQGGVLPAMEFDFTGGQPDPAENDLKLERLVKTRCNFLGRVEAFRDLILSYDLVINPSRMETFGMAAIEVLAAGVPLLSSRTGVIESVQTKEALLFPPSDPEALARALKNILERWQEIDFALPAAQENIRSKFLIDQSVAKLDEAYEQLIRTAP